MQRRVRPRHQRTALRLARIPVRLIDDLTFVRARRVTLVDDRRRDT
jgi:hypothetical protein